MSIRFPARLAIYLAGSLVPLLIVIALVTEPGCLGILKENAPGEWLQVALLTASAAFGFTSRPGFILMLIGVFVALAWAQLMGMRHLWEELRVPHVSESKRMAEELLELVGYYLILCGSIEKRLSCRRVQALRRGRDEPFRSKAP